MSLSAHEKIQFERLTADLALDDSDLKKMAKRDKANAMSYVALPSRNTILMVLAAIALIIAVYGGLTRNVIQMNVAGVFSLLLATAAILTSREKPSAANSKTNKGEQDCQ